MRSKRTNIHGNSPMFALGAASLYFLRIGIPVCCEQYYVVEQCNLLEASVIQWLDRNCFVCARHSKSNRPDANLRATQRLIALPDSCILSKDFFSAVIMHKTSIHGRCSIISWYRDAFTRCHSGLLRGLRSSVFYVLRISRESPENDG